MASLYDELKERVRLAARVLALPLGWEGEPFVPPHASHLRARIVLEGQRVATLGANGLTKLDGHIEIKVVVKAGEDSLASTLAGQVAQRRLDAARTAGQELRSLILRQSVGASDTGAMQDQISQLQQQLDSLEASAASDTKSIAAQSAGYYSAVADGY